MIQGYKILTVTHHNARLNTLGAYAFAGKDTELPVRLKQLKQHAQLEELIYLSTCNRVTYFFYTDQKVDSAFMNSFFTQVNAEIDLKTLDKVKFLEGRNALNHLFEVAASMDSLVVGEREILRQLRQAYQQCRDWKLTGDHMRIAMRAAVEGAKEIYARTRIGEKPISIVSLAIQKLLNQKISRNARILLIGAGQTNTLVTKFLRKHEYKNVTIFNRSLQRAKQLASLISGRAMSLKQLPDYQDGFDVMIICTGATEALVNSSLYQKLLNGDTDTKLLIDLAIPNNIDREVVNEFNVKYIEIEDLRNLAKENLSFRQNEVVKGRQMLTTKINGFIELHRQRQIAKAMKNVPAAIKAVKSHAINKVFKKELEHVDEETKALIERMMNYMEKQCIGIPMRAAKEQQTTNIPD